MENVSGGPIRFLLRICSGEKALHSGLLSIIFSSITKPHCAQTSSPLSGKYIKFLEPHEGHEVTVTYHLLLRFLNLRFGRM